MTNCDKLLRQAQTAPNSLRFDEVCQLAECNGFTLARQRGSHRMYKRPGEFGLMNFQDDNGKAKGYQVKQLLLAIVAITPRDEESEVEEDAQI